MSSESVIKPSNRSVEEKKVNLDKVQQISNNEQATTMDAINSIKRRTAIFVGITVGSLIVLALVLALVYSLVLKNVDDCKYLICIVFQKNLFRFLYIS